MYVAVPASELTKSAKKKRVSELIDTLLTESIYLGYTREELFKELESRAAKFLWKGG